MNSRPFIYMVMKPDVLILINLSFLLKMKQEMCTSLETRHYRGALYIRRYYGDSGYQT